MRKICSCLFQVLIGIYLIFVGGYLAYRMWEERPENITWMCGIAAVFVLTGKEKRLWTLSRVIWIRYDRVRPPEDLGYRKEQLKKIKLDR